VLKFRLRCLLAWRTSRLLGYLRDNEFIRFVLTGGVNTLFGFSVYAIAVTSNLHLAVALFVGMLAGTVFNFLTTGGYVFRQLAVARYPRFVACYFFIYGINLLMMNLFTHWLSSTLLIQGILSIPLAVLSYVILSRFVFARKNGKRE
jgi:putative flippase GtrA